MDGNKNKNKIGYGGNSQHKIETYESEFAYTSIIPKSGLKSYLNPAFKGKMREDKLQLEDGLMKARVLFDNETNFHKNSASRQQYSSENEFLPTNTDNTVKSVSVCDISNSRIER